MSLLRLPRPMAAVLLAVFSFVGLTGCEATHNGPQNIPVAGGSAHPSAWQLQDAAKVTETPEILSQLSYEPKGWYNATVPGTVLTSLVNDGVYPEPLYGENNRPDKIPESLSRASYWYRTKLTIPSLSPGKRVWLNFDGINYMAEVWINGHNAGEIKGAFARGVFDITDWVHSNEPAALAVHILPPLHPGNPAEQTQLAGTGRNGGDLAQDGPTFLSTVGWDWIPAIRDRDMGIWQSVYIATTGPVLVQDPLITCDIPLPRTDSADLSIETTLRNVTTAPQSGILRGTIGTITFQMPVALQAGESRLMKLTPATTTALHLVNPRLWWPNGYGPQNLYTLKLQFETGGTISDSRAVSFGVRKITYDVPNSQNLTISVNGVPIMCKGGNWGMDEAMKRIPRERLEAQIRMHQMANYNMIRNWVGQSTSEDFYDLCDRYGILVWDEMFQPNKSDGPNPNDVELYLANVREKVLRFRNHPCIAIWCGRNESNPQPAAVDEGIQKIMEVTDPSRMYHRNSADGRGVRSGGPYAWRVPRQYYTFPATEAFKTEIGSVSIPTLEAVRAMMPAKDWEVINDDWAEHDLLRGAQAGDRYPIQLGQRYGTLTNLPDFVRKGQLANYEAYRAMYEGRFAKLFNPSTGVITWMSNPSQPSFVWQLYSHDLEPNAALFAARKACEPIHVQMNQSDFHIMVINNTPKALEEAVIRLRMFNLDGVMKAYSLTPVTAPPTAAKDVGLIEWPDDLTAVHFIDVELRDAAGHLISQNFYWRALPDHQDDFSALNTLAAAPLEAKVVRHDASGKCLLDLTLTNKSPVVALLTHVQLRKEKSHERVLPVYYSDNYVSLAPDESRTITIEAATDLLGNETPLLVLDGWNATVKTTTFHDKTGPSVIKQNAEASPSSVPAHAFGFAPAATRPAR